MVFQSQIDFKEDYKVYFDCQHSGSNSGDVRQEKFFVSFLGFVNASESRKAKPYNGGMTVEYVCRGLCCGDPPIP